MMDITDSAASRNQTKTLLGIETPVLNVIIDRREPQSN